MKSKQSSGRLLEPLQAAAPECLRTLILDDSEADRYRLRRLCEQAGLRAEVVEVADLSALASALDNHVFDLIFLDYHLRMETGLEALEIVNQRLGRDRAVTIMATSVGDHDIIIEAMRNGCTDYLIKEELSVDRLRRSITGAFERRIFLASLDGTPEMGELNTQLARVLRSAAPEIRELLAEMLRRLWRSRSGTAAGDDAESDTRFLNRACGELSQFVEGLEGLAKSGGGDRVGQTAKGEVSL